MYRSLSLVCFILFVGTGSVLAQTPNVKVTISNIRSSDGPISLGVFKDNESFEEEQAWKSLHFSKKDMKNGTLTVSFYLPPGVYGLSLLDDENNNDEMDYNWVGIPEEGFGFSDGYWHSGLSRPKIEDFDITVRPGTVTATNMKIKYMLDRD